MSRGIAWDDLQYILAVADHGSVANAARALGVNHTTVLRRVNAFEEAQGVRLFERLPSGYAATPACQELLIAAREMAEVVADFERRLAGQDHRVTGVLRVTTTDSLLFDVLPEILTEFEKAHPGVVLEVTASNLVANLARRDADIAIRPMRDPPETLIGRRIASVAMAIYGPLAATPIDPDQLDATAHRWVTPDDSLASTSAARWLRSHVPPANIAVRADSFVTVAQLTSAGAGLAVLPCYLGDRVGGLKRLSQTIPEMETALWLLTHEDLKVTARVSRFMEFAAVALMRKRALFEGAADDQST